MRFLLLKYMGINKIATFGELMKLAGFKSTNFKHKLNHPEELRVYEIRALDEILHFSTEDLVMLVREALD